MIAAHRVIISVLVVAGVATFGLRIEIAHAQTPTPTVSASASATTTPTSSPGVVSAAAAGFHGNVLVDGAPATDGTAIQAIINGINCGSATTQAGRYSVTVKAGTGSPTDPDFQQGCGLGCGRNCGTVSFEIGGRQANETGQFIGHAEAELNLTFGQARPSNLPPTGATGSDVPTASIAAVDFLFLVGSGLAGAGVIRIARRKRGPAKA